MICTTKSSFTKHHKEHAGMMKKLIFHHLPSKISSSHQRPLLQICTTHRVPELRTNVLSFGKPNARTPQRDALIFTGCLKLLSMVSDIIDSNSRVLHMFASLATIQFTSDRPNLSVLLEHAVFLNQTHLENA